MQDFIKIRGARQHNLKNIDLDIPKNKLVCFTGVSGSGKSSLAFDTIYAEGQRRYVESLSTYARQFLGVMEKPDVDAIEGLSPAISIDQKTVSKNPRSTVGTITEIYDYLRLLFARAGHPHCPICKREIKSQSAQEIAAGILQLIKEAFSSQKQIRFLVLSRIVTDKKGEFSALFENLKAKGFNQVRVDNIVKDLSDDFLLIKTNKHTVDAVVDRISLNAKDFKDEVYVKNLKGRLNDSIEQALKLSEGLVLVAFILDPSFTMPKNPKIFADHLFSEKFSCPIDNISLPEIEPRTFSFNSPHGACPNCHGIGKILKVDPGLMFSRVLSITEGGVLPFANIFDHDTWYARLIKTVCEEQGIDPHKPINQLTINQLTILLNGTGDREYKVYGTNRFGKETFIFEKFFGFTFELESRHTSTESDWVRYEIEKYMREKVCPECGGKRLKKEALGVTIDKLSISDVSAFTIDTLLEWIKKLLSQKTALSQKESEIAITILKEIETRLTFLYSVGIEYLTLDRPAATLAGGEAQRIRLASQIGSGLTGILYVLDEPTIGLHPKDSAKLIGTLVKLKNLNNTVVVVEHDEETIRACDYVFDFGPGAGKKGGEIIAQGTPNEIAANPKSVTGAYLAKKKRIGPANFKAQNKLPLETSQITIDGCTQFNLKNISVSFPLGKLVAVTGVSGSGKSTLLVETLYPILATKLNPRYRGNPGSFENITGVDNVNKVILIDQSPIGKTPRSNPATYTKLFDPIRDAFAVTREAKAMGFKKGRFSFNVKGGRCEVCEGQGQTKIEMQFMSDIWVTCEVCKGLRYNAQTLEVNYRGKNIADVLALTIDDAIDFFHSHPKILSKLVTLSEVGLGYMELGQSAITLSGGEAQRVKLATELSKKEGGKTVYILDEPTTGLHFADVANLLNILRKLVDRGNSVFIIEHNIDVIKNSDWIIDLGPGGGEKGGEVVACGKLNEIIAAKRSYTGEVLGKK